MQELFLGLVKLSLIGSLFALTVILVRLVFRKAPKWLICLLWGAVALRLICPFALESPFSLIPDPLASGQLIESVGNSFVGPVDVHYESNADYSQAVEAGRQPIYSSQGFYVVTRKDSLEPAKTVEETVYPLLSGIWLAGTLLMLGYLAISFLALRRKMAEATRLQGNIWQCEQVDSPFVLGLIKPRIYLPYSLAGPDLIHVIAHEQAHIHRKDHWWKPLGFLLLSFHWFNPILWLSYILLCRDIEAACDEKVICRLEKKELRAYSTALLNCSIHRRRIAACPLAFGEAGVKERIKRVMSYKKPTFWILLGAVLVCIAVIVCFATIPAPETEPAPGLQTGPAATDPAVSDSAAPELLALVEQIAGNPACAASSNPYDYIEARRTEYDKILSFGKEAVGCFVPLLRQGENGLKGYIMAAACSEITGIGVKSGKYDTGWWATAQEWLALYDSSNTYLRSAMTLDDILALSEKGMDLIWEDLASYACMDTGSGLYVMRFDIAYDAEPEFYLLVGDTKLTGKPLYALLCTYAGDQTVDIREGDVEAFLEAHHQRPLDLAISTVIANRYDAEQPDGLIHTQSYVLLHSETASATPSVGNGYHRQVLRVYLLVMARRYTVSQGSPQAVSDGELIPTRLTFHVDGENIYSLREYWTPDAEGNPNNFREEDVLANFPEEAAGEALNTGKYRPQLEQACDQKMLVYYDRYILSYTQSLTQKYEDYFRLDAAKGQKVYVYQMAADSYSCVLAHGEADYDWAQLSKMTHTTLDEMRQIVSSYGISREHVQIVPVRMPLSSYWYTIDEAYQARLEGLFWSQTYPQFAYPTIDSILYDLDGDGMQEICTLEFGPTSGFFSFLFRAESTVDSDSDAPLQDMFVLTKHYDLSFAVLDSSLMLRGTPSLDPDSVTWFDIAVRDGHICLQCEEEDIFLPAKF